MPAQESGVDIAQKASRGRLSILSPGHLPDAQGADGVGRWLAKGAGVRRRGRGFRKPPRAGPVLGAGEVALRRSLRVEDDAGHLAVAPLMLEERKKRSEERR